MATLSEPGRTRTDPAESRKVWLIASLIVGFNLLLVLWILLQPAGPRASAIVTNLAGCVGPLLVLPLCFGGPRSSPVSPGRRWAPIMLGLGIVSYTAGRIVFTYFVWFLDRLPPMPSVATIGFLGQYPFLLAGILLLLPRYATAGVSRLRVVLDGLMIMTVVVTFSWYFFLGPVLYRASETILAKTFATAYPLADIVLIASLLVLALRPGRSVRAALPVMALGLVLIVVTDAIYGYGRINDTYVTGTLSDVGWSLGYMLLGLSAYLIRIAPADRPPTATVEGEPHRLWPSLLPYALVPAVAALAIYAWRSPDDGLDYGIYVGGALLLLLLLLRQVLTIVENSRLYVRLRHEKDYSDALVSNSPAAIVTMDRNGRVSSWNPAAEKLFGYSRDQAVGKTLEDLILPTAELREESANFLRIIGNAGQVHAVTQRSRRDQTLVDVELLSVPVTMGDGEATTYLAIYHDITELQRSRQQAETANRAKSTFLANMSHELRTPLNAIIGYSEMLHEDAQDLGQDAFVPDLEKITSAGRHLLGLINAVLDLSKIEAGKMDLYLETFEVADLISDTAALVEPLVRQNANELEVHCPESIGTMRADLTKVRQSLFNLLSNAAKFTRDGIITLSAARSITGGEERIVMSVTDTGIGLTEEQTGRLFEEFSQAEASTARDYGGTGLGLALSLRLCRMMGGDITVASVPGQGSTFTITLPATVTDPTLPQPIVPPEPRAPQVEETVHAPSTVLVIDDDAAVRDLLERFLGKEGFRVVSAGAGADGLRLAAEVHPDAITLDAMMPGMDGWSVLAALKADPELADIPVIMLTLLDDRSLGYALGAANYLTKPIERERLISVLNQYRKDDTACDVLLVDDDESVRLLARQMLEHAGFAVAEAADGNTALEAIAERHPAVIVLDLVMPGMDGFELIARLRSSPLWRTIPVVVMTAKDLSRDERQRLDGYVEGVISKGDSSREQLLTEVSEHIRGLGPIRSASHTSA